MPTLSPMRHLASRNRKRASSPLRPKESNGQESISSRKINNQPIQSRKILKFCYWSKHKWLALIWLRNVPMSMDSETIQRMSVTVSVCGNIITEDDQKISFQLWADFRNSRVRHSWTRSLDLSRVRRNFQTKSGRQTDKNIWNSCLLLQASSPLLRDV